MGMRKYKRQIAREIMAKHGMKFKSDGVFEKIFTGNRMTRSRRVRAQAEKQPLPLWKRMLSKYAL